MGEFDLIARLFAPLGGSDPDVRLGIGDDAAVLAPPVDAELVLTCDSLIEGIHLPAGAPAVSWGRRLAAVNLSDLGAMGAAPRWGLLALTIPEEDDVWLADFARGLGERLADARVALVGGNTARGPRVVTLTLLGALPPGSALKRSTGHAGDAVLVTGVLGAGALARRLWEEGVRDRRVVPYLEPEPPWRLGALLRGKATAAIDISDGFLADLGHLLEASAVGAEIDLERLPLAPGLDRGSRDDLEVALTGGDDYELCLTAPEAVLGGLVAEARDLGIALTPVGRLTLEPGLRLFGAGRSLPVFPAPGHDHFRTARS
jgi:thiamine-monophosphate kinase